jgi:hypothetical protein
MKNLIAPIILSLVAAVSSVICARLSIPVWTMFIGWIAFVAGGMRASTAAPTFVSAVLGLVLGIVGALIIGGTTPAIGADLALLVAVFVIVLVALLAQYVPFANVVVCYFIGMTTFFASGLPPEGGTALSLAVGLLVGILSGLLAVTIAGMLEPKAVRAPA